MTFGELKGKTITGIFGLSVGSNRVVFEIKGEKDHIMYHSQDCCESVAIEDICGDPKDIMCSEILMAEESTSDKNPEGVTLNYQDSFTWTFYRLSTIKGTVVIRWYGDSNGYYSESVDFEEYNTDSEWRYS